MKKVYLFLLFIFICTFIYSMKVKYIGNAVLFEKGDNFIREPTSFFVTEDNFIYIFDAKASNIKIYKEDGKFIKSFGRYGLGPDEFIRPAFGTYRKGIIVINDLKRDHLFVYRRDGNNSLKFLKKFFFSGIDNDMHFYGGNKLLLAGLNSDKNRKGNPAYGIISFDILNNKTSYILYLSTCFGFKSQKELDEKMMNGLISLVPAGYVDFIKNYIFYVYAGDIRIIRFNERTKRIITFGEKTEGYIKPYVTKEIINSSAMIGGNSNRRKELINKMSFVLKLFTVSDNRVFIVYTKYNTKIKNSELFLQCYNINGKFIKEYKMNEVNDFINSEIIFYFKKDSMMLYAIKTEINSNFSQRFLLFKYRIVL